MAGIPDRKRKSWLVFLVLLLTVFLRNFAGAENLVFSELTGNWNLVLQYATGRTVAGKGRIIVEGRDIDIKAHIYTPGGMKTIKLESDQVTVDSIAGHIRSIHFPGSWYKLRPINAGQTLTGSWYLDGKAYPWVWTRQVPKIDRVEVVPIKNGALDYRAMKKAWKYASASGNLPLIALDIYGQDLPIWDYIAWIDMKLPDRTMKILKHVRDPKRNLFRVNLFLRESAMPGGKVFYLNGTSIPWGLSFDNYGDEDEESLRYTVRKLETLDETWRTNEVRLRQKVEKLEERCLDALKESEASLQPIELLGKNLDRLKVVRATLRTRIRGATERASAQFPPSEMLDKKQLLKDLIYHQGLLEREKRKLDGRLNSKKSTKLFEAYQERVLDGKMESQRADTWQLLNMKKGLLEGSGGLTADERKKLRAEIALLEDRFKQLEEEELFWKRYKVNLGKEDRLAFVEEELARFDERIQAHLKDDAEFTKYKAQAKADLYKLQNELGETRKKILGLSYKYRSATSSTVAADRMYLDTRDELGLAREKLSRFRGDGRPLVTRALIRPASGSSAIWTCYRRPGSRKELDGLNEDITRLKKALAQILERKRLQKIHVEAAADDMVELAEEYLAALNKSMNIQMGLDSFFLLLDFYEATVEGGLAGLSKELAKKMIVEIVAPLIKGDKKDPVGFKFTLPDNVDPEFAYKSEFPGERISTSVANVTIKKVKIRYLVAKPIAVTSALAGYATKKTNFTRNFTWSSWERERLFKKIDTYLKIDTKFSTMRSEGWKQIEDAVNKKFAGLKDLSWEITKDVANNELKQLVANQLEGNSLKALKRSETRYIAENTLLGFICDVYHEIRMALDGLFEQRDKLMENYDPVSGYFYHHFDTFEEDRDYTIEIYFAGSGAELDMAVTLGGQAARQVEKGRTTVGGQHNPKAPGQFTRKIEMYHVFQIRAKDLDHCDDYGIDLKVKLN